MAENLSEPSAGARLLDAYANRDATLTGLMAQGESLVGVFGFGAPAELMLATGHTPVAIAPATTGETPATDRYFTPGLDAQVRYAFDRLVSGALLALKLAIVVSRFENDALLYHACKEVLRRGEGEGLPPLELYAALGGASEPAVDYRLAETRRLASRLKAQSGIAPTPARLGEAVAVMNRVRAAGQRLLDLRRKGEVSGLEAFRIIGGGNFLGPVVFAELLERYLDEPRTVVAKGAPRVLLISAARLFFDDLHLAIEQAGGQVVGEDDAWGARAFGPPLALEGDPMEALSAYYRTHTPNRGVFPRTARFAWVFDEIARADVDAVVIYMPLTDTQLGWDYPPLRDAFEAAGKPHLVLRDDIFAAGGPAKVVAATKGFLSQIGQPA